VGKLKHKIYKNKINGYVKVAIKSSPLILEMVIFIKLTTTVKDSKNIPATAAV